MEAVHRIHLGNAWEPPTPGDGGGWRRHFGLPSGLGPGTRVWLVIEQPMACGVVLNAHALPAAVAGAEYRHEVGGLLAQRNELVLLPAEDEWGRERIVLHNPLPSPITVRQPLPRACGRVWLEITATGP
jgi:hypothetical protein